MERERKIQVEFTEEEHAALVAVLKDHEDCLKGTIRFSSGREINEELKRIEAPLQVDEAEIDSKSNLIFEIQELITTIENGRLGTGEEN